MNINPIELQPLKENSVYVVKFSKDLDIQHVGKILNYLNDLTKDKNIIFIPSCGYFEIKGEV